MRARRAHAIAWLRYEMRARDLRRFDRFLQSQPELNGEPFPAAPRGLAELASETASPADGPAVRSSLSQAMQRRDETIPILPIEMGLQRRVLREERKPHIYTEAEIVHLFQAARTFRARNAPLRAGHGPHHARACILRGPSDRRDRGPHAPRRGHRAWHHRNPRHQVLQNAAVAAGPSGRNGGLELSGGATSRGRSDGPDAPLWWTPQRRKGYTYGELDKLLTRVIRRAGLKPARGCKGPRVHDLRHAFVAHRMLQWYREGVEPQSRLPHLATYLGHKDIVSTLVYLNITPELLQQASERYRLRGAQALGAAGGRP